MAKTITARINDGLFGINAALWDGDLLDSKTKEYVKAVRHKVIRYPGGLRADDDHWRQVLDKKDGMVDTDEFLDWLKETGTEAMFTVNFGKGTPQEAADWVKYVNKTKKAGVRFWEIGNELYGDWHPQHTTGTDYGMRAAEFIKAMKAADPSIQVAVVWVLDGL
ncbi:MAG: carbohydrate-binding protein, partial [Fibrobacterota bacterium]|nr:carbohydrate-binding protein [Fibrobacterota bacterium]